MGPERPCGVWRWNGEYAEVWVKQQRPHICKRSISTWFGGIPMNKIDLHCLYQGASFGGWSQMGWNLGGTYCAAVVAKRTGRPVKWFFNRREDFYGGEMDAGVFHFKVGAKLDGTITAVEERGVVVNQTMLVFGIAKHFIENTKIPHVYGRTEGAWVNKGPNVPTRCEQNLNSYALDLVTNHVAEALGLDPIDVALKNDGAEGHDIEWLNERKAELGFPVRDSLRECVEKGKAAIDWDNKRHAAGAKRLPNGRMHGMAFAWTHEWDDSAGTGEVAMYIERNDATVTILGCRADGGQNAETSYCQIAADELGFRVEDVRFKHQDDAGFYTMTPDTSTNLTVNGWAVRHAARMLKQKILETAVAPRGVTQLGGFPPAFPDKRADELDIRDGVIFEKADPSNRMTVADFVGPSGAAGPLLSRHGEPFLAGKEGLAYPMRLTPPLFEHAWQIQRGTYLGARVRFCRQAHFMEVEVDPETGEVDITKVVTVNDVGKVINWDGCEGQAYGGAYMGVGRGRTEEVVHDRRTGVMLNGNLLNYKIPTLMDIGSIDTILVETGMGYGPYGTVGIGEDVATVVPVLIGPAIQNAIGVWVEGYPSNTGPGAQGTGQGLGGGAEMKTFRHVSPESIEEADLHPERSRREGAHHRGRHRSAGRDEGRHPARGRIPGDPGQHQEHPRTRLHPGRGRPARSGGADQAGGSGHRRDRPEGLPGAGRSRAEDGVSAHPGDGHRRRQHLPEQPLLVLLGRRTTPSTV